MEGEDKLIVEAERRKRARRMGRGPYRKSALYGKKRCTLT
jgi:hypothetical protein